MTMKSVCVFLGSSHGDNGCYARAAVDMGRELARRGLNLVYGGSDTGLMKTLADSALEAGGRVIGVTVKALRDKEIYHHGLAELHVVETMHQRKQMMADLSDGFVALPGGIGTLDELFEVYTWNLLGYCRKPLGLLDVEGFYGPLLSHLAQAEAKGFLKVPNREMMRISGEPGALLDMLENWRPDEVDWAALSKK